MTINLHLKSILSPGDAVVMTMAIKSLHDTYPGAYKTSVETAAMEIWENNPNITKMAKNEAETVNLNYSDVHRSNQLLISFPQAYVNGLMSIIKKPLILTTNKPDLYLTEEEKQWMDQIQQHFSNGRKIPFWIINTGIKKDYTAKQWPVEYYQEIVDKTAGHIQWVQIGANEHEHHPLRGVISLLGATNHRQLIRLVYHCDGGVGPSTYLQHLCAAFEKPYICLLGGREPVNWVTYPKQFTLHTIGQLHCCKNGACWRSRVMPLGDRAERDKSICDIPVIGMIKPVAKCMAMIHPDEVLSILCRA